MQDRCIKCSQDTTDVCSLVKDNISYHFCRECYYVLKSFPVPENWLSTFLSPDEEQSRFIKNIFQARRLRGQGKSNWV